MRNTLFLILLVSIGNTWAQNLANKERFPSFFGVAVSPVIPNNFIGATSTIAKDSAGLMTTNFKNKWGITFGATVRIGISKRFSIETGISQVRRNYVTDVSIPDSNINDSQKLTFINYDIPLNGLVYVQMTEKWFMDVSLGVSITHYPSDVRDSMQPTNTETINVELRRTARTYFAFNAGLGFEYRTEKIGNFFLGFGAKIPFKQPYIGVSLYNKVGYAQKITSFTPISAGYFTIDFRYFLPQFKNKKLDKNKPLIE